MRQYFLETSYNNLTIEPAGESQGTTNDGVIGWLWLGYHHPAADGMLTSDESRWIAKNALTAANPYVNFAASDTDGDGALSQNELQIIVIVAGHEYGYDTTFPTVWYGNDILDGIGCPTLDGITLACSTHSGGYSIAGELHNEHQATIGTLVYDVALGLGNPTLYDQDGSSSGLGYWSLMSSGNWNTTGSNPLGSSPAHLDPFLKHYMGWLTPTPIDGTITDLSIPQVETAPVAYQLRANPDGLDWELNGHSGSGEYFLVENRQQTGFDAGLPGCGLLIWHVDESAPDNNSANSNEDFPLIKLVEADGLYNLYTGDNRGDTGDPYPGSTANVSFGGVSTPSNTLFDGYPGYATLSLDSTTCSSEMQADLDFTPPLPGTFAKLSPLLLSDQPTTLTLDWQDADYADGYQLCYDNDPEGSCTGSWNPTGSESRTVLAGLLPGHTYEWQVRAFNSLGTTDADGGLIGAFDTADHTFSGLAYLPLLTRPHRAPGAFSKTTPTGGKPMFRWHPPP